MRLGLQSLLALDLHGTVHDDGIGQGHGRRWVPELLRHNIACVDWSVAKGGFLCASRWDGEQKLDAGKFVWAE
jgi:hypothetical protein